jgi:hypothetical protein
MQDQSTPRGCAVHNRVSNANMTVTLTAKQHETLMYAALDQITRSASILEEQAGELRDTPAARRGSLVEDTQLAFGTLREDLDAIEALGWPEDIEGDPESEDKPEGRETLDDAITRAKAMAAKAKAQTKSLREGEDR